MVEAVVQVSRLALGRVGTDGLLTNAGTRETPPTGETTLDELDEFEVDWSVGE